MAFELTPRQSRLLNTLLVLGTVAVALVVIAQLASVFFYFGDVILIFFLSWLLAFILSPIVSFLVRNIPALPRIVAVIVVYSAILGVIVVLAVVLAGTLAQSITTFIGSVPSLKDHLPEILKPWQERLNGLGFSQVDLTAQATAFLSNLNAYASQLVGPLQQLAVASLGVLGNLLFVLILSLYMVIDRDRILSFLFRIVPPSYAEEAHLLETSVAESFGGFLRGQALMGLIYGTIAAIVCAVMGLDYLPIVSVAAGTLQAIPFFGPFISWTPPILVAFLLKPEVTLPALIVMGVGWFVVMNILQPRLMQSAVGIHPIVVLGSVLIGSKIAGITGAIFGIPVAAVISAFFFHYLGRSGDLGTVAERAARRVANREGRSVRVPREPGVSVDPAPTEPPIEVAPRGGQKARKDRPAIETK
jgi:predicted PurR-regulated permease PerM